MNLRDYEPLRDAGRVFDLWQRALGHTYPVSERVFACRASGRFTYEAGDGVVAEVDGELAGFAVLELARSAETTPPNASLMAILVDPARQRQGIGTALLDWLEQSLRRLGVKRIGCGGSPHRFWTAMPDDLVGSRRFFERRGYVFADDWSVVDMIWRFDGASMNEPSRRRMADAGVSVAPMQPGDVGPVLGFEQAEFASWVPGFLELLHAGDGANILVMRHGAEIVGTTNTFTPSSRWRGPNLVWERLHGGDMGGLGAVGIAPRWRGRGLGLALCEAAGLHIRERGAACCFIDWTNIPAFYERLGARVWRVFHSGSKALDS